MTRRPDPSPGFDSVAQRPISWAGVDPILPSAPDAPAVALDPDSWPYAAVTLLDADDLVLRVQSTGAPAPFEVRLRAIENGRLVSARLATGTLGAGETRTIPIPEPDAALASIAGAAAVLVLGAQRRRRSSSSSSVFGQSSCRSRESARSASSLPSVWQRAQ